MLQLLKDGQADTFNHLMSGPADPQVERTFAFRARPYGANKSPCELFTEVNRYTLYDVAGRITAPLLTTDPRRTSSSPVSHRSSTTH